MNGLPPTLAAVSTLGFKVFERGAFNLNLIGIRSPSRDAGRFDDTLEVWFREFEAGPWVCHRYAIRTDPGVYWLEHPMRVEGTAILVPGQYRGAWEVGTHKGYAALRQRKPVKVYRDNDRDSELDEAAIDEGLFGINIHASDPDPFDSSDRDRSGDSVGRWSAGCQVFARSTDYRDFWDLIQKAAKRWGPVFTYTLIEG